MAMTLLLLSCGRSDKGHFQNESVEKQEFATSVNDEELDGECTELDSLQVRRGEEEGQSGKNADVPSPTKPHSPSSLHDDNEINNMRGFDPPSEDDMDDNGMSRYMENDDDEGWE